MSDAYPLYKRPIAIASFVALLHVGGLAALQSGLLGRAYELVVPVEMISQIIAPPQPLEPILPPPAPAPEPVKLNKAAPLPSAPKPVAIAQATPAPNAPAATPAPPAPLPPIAAPVTEPATAPVAVAPAQAAAASAVSTPPAPAAKVELPRGDADYLNNPRPPYPPVSKRLGEQGRVMLRVFVGEDGSAQRVELRTSSGHERLDKAALEAVSQWRFKPGTRGGVPEAMWHLVPLDFIANN